MRVAVAGNPNSGKSTLFNALTGARARVGNYPGVTVERKEADARLPSGAAVRLVDLPGCYSLTAHSPEEEVAHHVLLGQLGTPQPRLTVCVVDATNLARGLYLVLQLLEMEIPLVVALNMIDVAKEQGLRIDAARLSERLGVPVIATSARRGTGLDQLTGAVERWLSSAPETRARPMLELRGGDREVVDALRAELRDSGQAASGGAALWLLTSDLDEAPAKLSPELHQLVRTHRRALDPDGSGAFNRRVIEARYRLVDELLEGVVDASRMREDLWTQRLDRVLLHPVGGFLAFAAAMLVVFQTVFSWAQPFMDAVEAAMGWLADAVGTVLPESMLRSMLVNGVIAGIGNIVVFLPQIAFLVLLLTILEESGYMARAAFLLDRTMRRVGLHGKAFLPLMSGFACAVPAIVAARTIESRRDRLVTMMVTPFMSCSARLPIYVLVVAAVFAATPPLWGVVSVGGLVIAAMYLLGFVAAIATAWLLKRTTLRSAPMPLIMELPSYKLPTVKAVARQVYDRCKIFVVQTGTIILALSLLLWALLTFPSQGMAPEAYAAEREAIVARALAPAEEDAALAELEHRSDAIRLEESFAGRIGKAIEPVIEPLGFDWRIGIGLVASFAAREVLVSTLGQVYALGSDVEPESPALRDALLADVDPATGGPRFTTLTGLSLMVFFVLAMQCLSTLAIVKRETNSWRWPVAQLVYMNGLAYIASWIVFQGGRALGL